MFSRYDCIQFALYIRMIQLCRHCNMIGNILRWDALKIAKKKKRLPIRHLNVTDIPCPLSVWFIIFTQIVPNILSHWWANHEYYQPCLIAIFLDFQKKFRVSYMVSNISNTMMCIMSIIEISAMILIVLVKIFVFPTNSSKFKDKGIFTFIFVLKIEP